MPQTSNSQPIPQRHHWVNTIVGVIDAAFVLDGKELFYCGKIVLQLVDALRIPDRGNPCDMPCALAAEVHTQFYGVQMHGTERNNELRIPRSVNDTDTVTSLESWRRYLCGIFLAAYPDLSTAERAATIKVLDDLLTALGVPARAARFIPDDVVRSHRREQDF